MDSTAGVSQATMAALKNLSVNTGAGNDTVNLDAYGKFSVVTGEGDDFVRINSVDDNGNATTGSWTFGQASGTQTWGTGFGLAAVDARVLYQAQLSITFAGIEKTVAIETTAANNFVADQLTINAAIKKAIAESPELSKLLTATDVTGTQQLKVVSNVGGLNDLGIAIYQPQLVATSAAVAGDGSNVLLAAGDVSALRMGLINTTSLLSNNLVDAAAIVAQLDNNASNANLFSGQIGANGAGNEVAFTTKNISHDVTVAVAADAGTDIFDTNGAANYYDVTAVGSNGGSSNDTVGVNFSVINAGAGNDLIVLHSNANSANVVKIDGAFGKNTIVNFHDVSPNDVAAKADVGNHALEFTFLDNQVDASTTPAGNAQSAKPIAVTVNNVTGATAFADSAAGSLNVAANSVNILRFIENVATPTDLQTFAGLTEAKLKAALNATAATANYGNLGTGGGFVDLAAAAYGTTLVGTTQKHILMVENGLNQGEYKVFELTSTLNSAGLTVNDAGVATAGYFTGVKEIGTLDFGSSVNLNVVGSEAWSILTTGNKLNGTVATGAELNVIDGVTAVTAGGLQKVADNAVATAATTEKTVSVSQTITADGKVTNQAGHVVDVSTITAFGAGVTLTGTATQLASLGAVVTGNATISGSATVAQANAVDAKVNGVVTATITEQDIALLKNLTGTGNAYTTTVANTTVAAADLTALDDKTTVAVTATAVTTLTGTATEVAAAYTAGGNSTITGLANEAVTLSDTAAVAATLKAINTATTGLITNTAATSLSGSLADVKAVTDALGTSGDKINLGAIAASVSGDDTNVTITISDAANSTLTAANLSAVGGATTGTVTVTNAQTVAGSAAEVIAALVTADTKVVMAGTTTLDLSNGAQSFTAAQLTSVYGAVGGTVVGTAADTITVTALTGATVAATESIDTFTFASGDVNVTITGFTSGASGDVLNLKAIDAAVTAIADTTNEINATAANSSGAVDLAAKVHFISNVGATVDTLAEVKALVTDAGTNAGEWKLATGDKAIVFYGNVADGAQTFDAYLVTGANAATDTWTKIATVGVTDGDALTAAANFIIA